MSNRPICRRSRGTSDQRAGAAGVAVRDSENPAGPVLILGPAGISRFLGWVTGVG
ncbi:MULTISPECIES: DUF397 domain-containing protein [unclassified Streptomyces]|uniref:DUF397 domain-containing protein n=1 Tax=unclassified Streptomyces TaxID=2593676 RepID=UPI0029A06152|nr:DUF397 domain-containing protein [Streptomyces sp. FL07-04A]MDX3578239.1 DUF397 domain-containing protein [Streptomyces sp. FL07-04A]